MILIVDDDSAIRSSLSFMLKRAHYDVTAVTSPAEAIAAVKNNTPMLILMDMNYTLATDGEEGLTLLKQIKLFCPDVPIILMTAWGSIQLAVKGMRAGAFDFITKPWNNASLMQRIQTAIDLSSGRDDKVGDSIFDRNFIIGQSDSITQVLHTVKRIAATNASVLITGESGTGKELIAEAIHRNSTRAQGPFVKVNLGGISQTLFESEMFGHKKGAFTDAVTDRIGRFEMADGGTIFLDEIGELDLSCQVKLLRVLQEQTFEPLGESRPRHVDIRVVCATNADLRSMVQQHTFREDLFYRINLINIHLPALRKRRDDIPLLAHHFADMQCQSNNQPAITFTADAIDFLKQLPYPGNIRELKNLIERTVLVCGKQELSAQDIRQQYQDVAIKDTDNDKKDVEELTLDEIERQTILKALDCHDGNLAQTAKALGISRTALYRRLEKHHISMEE